MQIRDVGLLVFKYGVGSGDELICDEMVILKD